MRLRWILCAAGLSLAAACAPEADDPSPAGDASRSGGATPAPAAAVHGVVRDARTDRPVVGALVSVGRKGTSTDAAGAYQLSGLSPGPMKLRAYRRGFHAESVTVVVSAGESAVADIPLLPAEPPCCKLIGAWNGSFTLDSAGLNSRPSTRELNGRLNFAPRDTVGSEVDGSRVSAAAGTSGLDFGPLLGSRLRATVRDVQGMVFGGDSVAITLLPQYGDWAIELRGRQSADTIRGDWFQRASCCGAYGRFVLVRLSEPASAQGE